MSAHNTGPIRLSPIPEDVTGTSSAESNPKIDAPRPAVDGRNGTYADEAIEISRPQPVSPAETRKDDAERSADKGDAHRVDTSASTPPSTPLYDHSERMSEEHKLLLHSFSQRYPRYLFRTEHRYNLTGSSTGAVSLTPFGMKGWDYWKTWLIDIYQCSGQDVMRNIIEHAAMQPCNTAFTSWTPSLVTAMRFARGRSPWFSTVLCILDTNTLPEPQIFHLNSKLMCEGLCQKDAYPDEFLVHSHLRAFKTIALSKCNEIIGMWEKRKGTSVEELTPELLDNARRFALRFDRDSAFAIAIFYIVAVLERQYDCTISPDAFDFLVKRCAGCLVQFWNASLQFRAEDLLHDSFYEDDSADIGTAILLYKRVREHILGGDHDRADA